MHQGRSETPVKDGQICDTRHGGAAHRAYRMLFVDKRI